MSGDVSMSTSTASIPKISRASGEVQLCRRELLQKVNDTDNEARDRPSLVGVVIAFHDFVAYCAPACRHVILTPHTRTSFLVIGYYYLSIHYS